MGRAPCCEKMGLKKGPWTSDEDHILINYIQLHGHGNWRALPKLAGLLRCGKSCRLRWTNYLRPDIKRGNFTPHEEDTIIQFHNLLGNRWSTIAAKLPGRTDNEIKNVWHTHLKKRAIMLMQQQHDDDNNILPPPQHTKRRSAGKKSKSITSIITSIIQQPQLPPTPTQTTSLPPVSPPRECSSSEDASSVITATGENARTATVKAEAEEMDDSFWSEVLSADNSAAAADKDHIGELGSGLYRFDSLVSSTSVGGVDDQEGEAAAALAHSEMDYTSMDFWYNLLTAQRDLSEEQQISPI